MELADTLDLGSSARAWGFKSLKAHQKDRKVFFIVKKGLEPERAIASERKPSGLSNSNVSKAEWNEAAGRQMQRI